MAKTTGGSWIFPAVVLATTGAAVAAQTGTQPIGVWVFAVVLGGWVITLCLHEFAHAAVAYAGGDISVRARGYLTLNPLRYTDLAYSVIIPILLLLATRWMPRESSVWLAVAGALLSGLMMPAFFTTIAGMAGITLALRALRQPNL